MLESSSINSTGAISGGRFFFEILSTRKSPSNTPQAVELEMRVVSRDPSLRLNFERITMKVHYDLDDEMQPVLTPCTGRRLFGVLFHLANIDDKQSFLLRLVKLALAQAQAQPE